MCPCDKNGIIDIIIGAELIKKFAKNEFPIECQIKTKENSVVSWSRPIRNVKEKEDFKQLIADYEAKGYLEKSRSVWLKPVVLNRKKSGELRFTLDLRKVNGLVDPVQFNIPNIQEIVKSLHGARYFSVLDLEDGIFQVPLCEADKDKTTFLDLNYQLKRFTRMHQGFKNSRVFFQRGISIVLDSLLGLKCLLYIDHI
ncbi:Retrovirus-related Pol polyprotein from transposon gypsy, partial [Dictyocoela muelleri]